MAQPLFAEERQQQIVRILERQQRATVSELSGILAVSEVTVRKYLMRLEEQKLITRTHGGAILANVDELESAFDIREGLQQAEKERIAAAAASMVQDGASIALDASTTALYVARCLRNRKELTVVTNSIRNGMELAGRPGITVLMPGGALRREAYSLVGRWGEAMFHQINIQLAFVGAKGFSLTEGLSDVNSEEVKLKSAIVERAKDVIAIIDHTKWGQVAFATFCPTERIQMVITDAQAPAEMVELVRRMGITVQIV